MAPAPAPILAPPETQESERGLAQLGLSQTLIMGLQPYTEGLPHWGNPIPPFVT